MRTSASWRISFGFLTNLQTGMSLCLMVCLVPQYSVGQACKSIILEAKRLGQEKALAEQRYYTLKANVEEKRRIIYDLSGRPAYGKQAPRFNQDLLKYHNERGLLPRCPLWGRTDWGKIKDFREANLDRFRHFIAFYEGEIDRLDSLLASLSQAGTSVRPAPALEPSAVTTPTGFTDANRATFQGKSYRYCIVDPHYTDLRIANRRSRSAQYSFETLDRVLRQNGKRLVMAMNAGMFEINRQPVGLLVAGGKELSPVNRRKGQGNFYMQPNGIFGISRKGNAFILSTQTYVNQQISPSQLRLATQSGPLLIMDGVINQKFSSRSSNLYFRNAVGIRTDGQVVFAISEQKVSFYELSKFLLDQGCRHALYLDGTVSRLYLPALSRQQDFFDSRHLGPILYIAE